MSKKTETAVAQSTEIEDIAAKGEQSMQTIMQSYNTWLRSAGQVQAEMLRFINKRICEDLEMPVRMAQCKSPADMVERQMSFANTMMEDYADESRKMMALMTDVAHDLEVEADAAFTDPLPH